MTGLFISFFDYDIYSNKNAKELIIKRFHKSTTIPINQINDFSVEPIQYLSQAFNYFLIRINGKGYRIRYIVNPSQVLIFDTIRKKAHIIEYEIRGLIGVPT
jgi:hypothetical protein